MAFRFPLQAVLRIRQGFERLEHLRLLAFAAIIAHVRREIQNHEKESSLAESEVQRGLAAEAPAAELHFEIAKRRMRGERKRLLEERLADLTRRHQRQNLVFLAARRKRQILENLRQRKLVAYQREQSRREQQIADELFLERISREKAG